MSMCVPGGSPAAGDGPDHTEDEAEQEKPPSEQSPPFQTREVEDAQPAQLDERADDAQPSGDAEATEAIRTAVTAHHGITPDDIVWKAPGEINRTSSGKIARRVAKKNYVGF